jgi:hypothetical protein
MPTRFLVKVRRFARRASVPQRRFGKTPPVPVGATNGTNGGTFLAVTAYHAKQWGDFALAQLGASAALLGLVFVGLSINLKDVIGSRQLVNRALEAVLALGSVLVASTAVLIPDQSTDALGVELLVVAVAALSVTLRLQIGAAAQVATPGRHGPPRSSILVRRIFGLGGPVLLAVAGVTLLATAGGGLYWWPAAIVVAYLGALTNAWVLMIEILR